MRAFILGNGISLRDVNLISLYGELVIACNRIHKHPQWEDGFRPSVWVFGDLYGNKSFKEEVRLHVREGYDCWIKSTILHLLLNETMEEHERFWWSDYQNIFPYQCCVHRRDMNPPASWHPPHICNFTGAINAMVQIAIWHYDVDEIYFLGIDGDIKKGKDGNHFCDGYQDVWYGPPLVERINDELQIGHTLIAKELKKAGIPAYNLTATSVFKQYPRMDLEEVLIEKSVRV